MDFHPSSPSALARTQLRESLRDLQKHAASYVNVSRLQLALRGLEQHAGQETIRIAILGVADGGASLRKARELLRLLLADPLTTEEEWERVLLDGDEDGRPLFLKVGHHGAEEGFQTNRLVREIHVSSPLLNGHQLEILVLEMDPPTRHSGEGGFVEAALVPTMEIPTSSTGRYTPVTTPVHKSLIVSEGIMGAATVLQYPVDLDREIVSPVVDLPARDSSALPFQLVNIPLGTAALAAFRQSVDHAFQYEKDWFSSGLPEVLDWIKSGTTSSDGVMKAPLRKLVESLLKSTSLAVEADAARQLGAALAHSVPSQSLASLRHRLATWAERAHTELRDELDIAFSGHRWRKLGWWKLFWRVDDVSMISTDILNQRFLTNAEKEIIFEAGCIAQTGIFRHHDARPTDWAYKAVAEATVRPTAGSVSPPPKIRDLVRPAQDAPQTKIEDRPWPLQIPIARAYLVQETVPALQALAQRLVLQTLGTSTSFSAFAGLMYVSSVTTTLYEAGGVAAVGIVWSLRRMQEKWETARKFWEREVREEGRKSVRAVERVVGDVLQDSTPEVLEDAQLLKARMSVARAEAALAASKSCQIRT